MKKSIFVLVFLLSFFLLSSIVSAQFRLIPLDVISNFFKGILNLFGLTTTAESQEKLIPSSGTIVYAPTECTCPAGYVNPGTCRSDVGETFTFGNSRVELSEDGDMNYIWAQKFFAPQTGQVESISIYIRPYSYSTFKLAIYDGAGNRLAQTSVITVDIHDWYWKTGNLQTLAEVTQGEVYWLAYLGVSGDIKFSSSSTVSLAGKERVIYNDGTAKTTNTFSEFPESFPANDKKDKIISISATYKSTCHPGEKNIGQGDCSATYGCCCSPGPNLITADNIIRCIMAKDIKLYVYDPDTTDCWPCRRQKKIIHYAKGLAGPTTLWDQFLSNNVIYAKPPTGYCEGKRPCWVWGSNGFQVYYPLYDSSSNKDLNTLFGCGLTPISGHDYHVINDFY